MPHSTFSTDQGKLHSQISGCTYLSITVLSPSSITAPDACKREPGPSYLCMMHKPQMTLLGLKLLTLQKHSYQPHAACPHSYPAPPPKHRQSAAELEQSLRLCSLGKRFFGRRFSVLPCKSQGSVWDLDLRSHSGTKRLQSWSSNTQAMHQPVHLHREKVHVHFAKD